MQLKILAFGIAKDIIGGSEIAFSVKSGTTVEELKIALGEKFPSFGQLNSLAIAVNNEYGESHQVIQENDEVVLIPPVSGG